MIRHAQEDTLYGEWKRKEQIQEEETSIRKRMISIEEREINNEASKEFLFMVKYITSEIERQGYCFQVVETSLPSYTVCKLTETLI